MAVTLSQDVLVALLTGTVVGFSLAAAFFVAQRPTRPSEQTTDVKKEDEVVGEPKKEEEEESSEAEDDSDDDLDEDPSAEPHKMVMVVNNDLGMGKGKIVAQCCHACLGAYKKASQKALLVWRSQGQAKIAVKATQDELLEVADTARRLKLPHYVVADAGRTQIPAGSITVCAVGPAPASLVDKVTSKFKLL